MTRIGDTAGSSRGHPPCPTPLPLACPACRHDLAAKETFESLHCGGCGLSFAIRDGIIDLRQHRKDYYFNPVKRERMREIIANLRQRPWNDTVHAFMGEVNGNLDWLDNLVVDGRYAWRLFLDLPPDGVALDLGCGLGNLAANLAPNVQRMVAMDLTMERLEFARERFALLDLQDRTTLIAAGDGRHLPFQDATFDLVTLSGVLEWIPDDERAWEGGRSKLGKAWRMVLSHFGASNSRVVQRDFLREIHRVTKPRGQVFVAIENRLGYPYFLGMPDHHSGLTFNSLLPRFAANLYSIARARKPYRTYTYSIPGFTKLFRDAGYARQAFYGLTPGYSHLFEITPARGANAIWSRAAASSILTSVKQAPLLVPAYGIVASKSTAPVSKAALINRIAARIERETSEASGALSISRLRVTGKDKAVLDARLGDRHVVVRIPFGAVAERSEDRNWRFITAAGSDAARRRLVPAPLAHGIEQSVPYYVESSIAGKSLTDVIRDGSDGLPFIREVTSLPQKYGAGSVLRFGQADFASQVEEPLARVASACKRSATNLLEGFRHALFGQPVAIGLSHGDFTSDNIFVAGTTVTGIIDWEESRERGLPLLDVIAYLESVQRVRAPRLTVAQTFASLAGDMALLSSPEVAALEDAFRSWETPLELRRPLALLAWLHHCDALARTNTVFDKRAIDERFGPLFESASLLDAFSSAMHPG